MTARPLSFALLRNDRPPEGETQALFPWWSITKSVLAAAVLRLAAKGSLALDEPYKGQPFTIRHLLQHTAGVRTYGGERYRTAVATGEPVWPVDDLLARAGADQLLFEPGKGWAYSNIGYLFVRDLIETRTGLRLGAALDHLVFRPLGITRTTVAETPEDMARTVWGNGEGYDPRWVYHGLLIGPPADAVLFLHRLVTSDFLSRPLRDTMLDRHALGGPLDGRPWTATGYGLGVMIGEMAGAGTAIGHSGVGNRSVSALYHFPDLPGTPTVAAFAAGTDEAVPEYEVLRRATA